jgi:hypothetical protein
MKLYGRRKGEEKNTGYPSDAAERKQYGKSTLKYTLYPKERDEIGRRGVAVCACEGESLLHQRSTSSSSGD